jgi:hypothetical protein
MLSQLLFVLDGHAYHAKVDREIDPPVWTVSVDRDQYRVAFPPSPDDAASDEFLRRLSQACRQRKRESVAP